MTTTASEATGEVVEGQAIRVQAGGGSGGPPVDMLAVLEQRNQLLGRVLSWAIQATHAEQWFDLGGKPWPSGPACETMARRCAVSITNISKIRRESADDKGPFYIWEVSGTASWPNGESIEVFGTCSSRDNFLGTETGAGRKVSEIDEGSIMKAAFTNMEINGITRFLGVRSLSWARLAELGLDREKMGKVGFNTGSQGGGQSASGSSMEIKFGKSKGKTLAQLSDEDLAWYTAAFERDATTTDAEKVKYKPNAEKQLAAAKAEAASRANAKSGTTPTNSAPASYWDRLLQLAQAQGFSVDKLKEVTKQILKKKPEDKVSPADLVEADFTGIADALAVLKAAKSSETF